MNNFFKMKTRNRQTIIDIKKLDLTEILLSSILLFTMFLILVLNHNYLYPTKIFIESKNFPKLNLKTSNNFLNDNRSNKNNKNTKNMVTNLKDTLDTEQIENRPSISFQDSVKILKKQIAERKRKLTQFDYLKNEYNEKIMSLLEMVEDKNEVIAILNEAKEQQIAKLTDSLKSQRLSKNNLTYEENNADQNRMGTIKIPKEIDSIKFTKDFDKFLEKHTKDSLSRYDSTDLDDFSNFVEIQEQKENSYSWQDIQINDIKFDIQGENILITLTLRYNCPQFFSEGKKSILLTRSSDKWKIINEDYTSIENIDAEKILINFVKDWQKAWESQNIDKYISLYSSDFQKINFNRKKWLRDKENKFENAEYIKVETSEYKITSNDRYTWQVTFNQSYKSDVYSDEGHKRLIIKGDLKNLKIINEKWWP